MADPLDLQAIGKQAAETFRSYLPSIPGLPALAKLGGGAFVALGAALFVGQRYIIYPAWAPSGSRKHVRKPSDHGMPLYEDLILDTPDGLKIKAYLILQGGNKADQETEAKRRPTVLFLHANAGNMGDRLPFAHIFHDRLKCNVFMLSYRGYGLSEGSPSEKGIKLDSQLALDYITSHPLLEKTPIILYGQSIGGAVATALAAANPGRIKGVILENTFTSLAAVAGESMAVAKPYIALGLLKDRWESEKSIAQFDKDLPLLFFSGSMDEVVPPSQHLALFKACSSTRKRLRQFPHGMHNDTCVAPGYWHEVWKWMKDEVVQGGEMPVFYREGDRTRNPHEELGIQEPKTSMIEEGKGVKRTGTFQDEHRMDGAEKELEGTLGAGSIAP